MKLVTDWFLWQILARFTSSTNIHFLHWKFDKKKILLCLFINKKTSKNIHNATFWVKNLSIEWNFFQIRLKSNQNIIPTFPKNLEKSHFLSKFSSGSSANHMEPLLSSLYHYFFLFENESFYIQCANILRLIIIAKINEVFQSPKMWQKRIHWNKFMIKLSHTCYLFKS